MLEENPDGLQVPAIPEYQDRWNDKFQEHQHNNPTELRLCGGVVALFMDAAFASDMLSSESERQIYGPGCFFRMLASSSGAWRRSSHLFSSQPTRPDALERVRVLLFGLRQVFGSLPLPCL